MYCRVECVSSVQSRAQKSRKVCSSTTPAKTGWLVCDSATMCFFWSNLCYSFVLLVTFFRINCVINMFAGFHGLASFSITFFMVILTCCN